MVSYDKYMARVERILDHNAETRSLFLRCEGAGLAGCLPGQFVSLLLPLKDEVRRRAYSVTWVSPGGELFEICFDRVPGGKGAEYLFERRIGDPLEFIGPFGSFVLEPGVAPPLVFIAEGTGVAPIRRMVKHALSGPPGEPVELLYGACASWRLLYRAELEALSRQRSDFRFEALVVPEAQGRPAALYDRLAAQAARRWDGPKIDLRLRFYICGIGEGVIRLRDLLRAAGYARRSVRYEKW
jgi:benzoate/toluate 1,2-dioxygenase reductase subunit